MLCVVLPNLCQLWLHARYPLQDGSQLAMQHRQLVHGAWDLPKDETLQPFYALYPQWKDTPPVTGRFHWKWYYAFQHMGDVHLQGQVAARTRALELRAEATAKMGWWLPTVWAQSQLEAVACSDVRHLLVHRQQIEKFHTRLREAIYPFLFEERALNRKDLESMPVFGADDPGK